VVVLFGVVLGLVATGAIAFAGPEFAGPLAGILSKDGAHAVKEVHEALAGLLLGLVGAHVAGVLFSSWREGQNLVAGMITGWKKAPPEEAGDSSPASFAKVARLSASLGFGVGAALILATLIGLPARAWGATSVAADLLREYEATARKERPAFVRFSAEEGRRIYNESHVQRGETVSCSTCHTADPKLAGRTPTGKLVDPLAPSANARRFTDRGDVEKWFKRNCKQVLGRECTAEEKGHLVTWFVGL